MKRMAALPRQALLSVVGRPHVVRGQPVHAAAVGHLEMPGHLGPGADAHAVGLLDPAVQRPGVGRGLAVGPDTLLERAAQLGLVGLAHEVDALVIEGRVEEEPLVLELEVALGLADSALAQGHELLALGERAHGDSPFFKSDRHRKVRRTEKSSCPRAARGPAMPCGGEPF